MNKLASSARRSGIFSFALRASLTFAIFGSVQAATIPANLGAGLEQLVVQQQQAARATQRRAAPVSADVMTIDVESRMLWDAQGRVLVNVLVDGQFNYAAVRQAVQRITGGTISAEDPKYRAGIIEMFVPVEALSRLGKTQGVSAVQAVIRPITNVGAVTQQGFIQHRVDRLSQDGTGVTIGILSDSYNTAANFISGAPLTIRESNDIASGDLPGTGNPLGNTQPVVVLKDLGVYPNTVGADEGRGMAQLIHDIAPKARLGFATAFDGEVAFANSIRALAGIQGLPNSQPGFAAQIIVDDVQYFAEGMFSDTVIAQAVDDVAALGVSYFASAGNTPPTQGYASDLRIVASSGAATAGTNVNLAGVPPLLYAGGFQNFRSDGLQDIAQTIRLTAGTGANAGRGTLRFVLQWDDPYDVTATTVGPLVFNQSGALTAATPQVDFAFNNPSAGQQYRVDVQGTSTKFPGSTLDVIVTVIQPDGSILIEQDTGNGETFSIFFPQQGIYTIRVTGFDGGPGPDEGPFTVRINQGSGLSRVTSDFNVLFFHPTTGAFLGAVAENNLATNRPIELPGMLVFPAGLTSVQMVISRANIPTAPVAASRLRYKFLDSSFPSEYFSYSTPITYGHNSAVGANGVAAYSPFTPNIPEDFTSTGPVRIVFDRNNNRIPEAQQVRLKPDMAAMDGGNTTFFTGDTGRDLDSFPNFFGTSAAAPTAAAIAALVLQKNGGPGSVNPAQMKTILQRSAFPHDLDPYSARGQAIATNRGKITVTIDGDNSLTSQSDPNAMSVAYVGPGSIASIIFDATNGNPGGGNVTNTNTPGQVFDIRANNGSLVSGGQPFVVGAASVGLSAADVTATVFDAAPPPSVAGQFFKLQLNFASGAFTGGKALRFGIDRDEFRSAFLPPAGDSRNGSSADLAGQAVRIPSGALIPGGIVFTGTLSDGSTFRGVLGNRIGAGWSFLDGFGFINAESAVGQPLP